MATRQYRSTVEAKTLSSGINNSVTSMTLNSVTTLPSSYPYTLVIDPDISSEEIVTVTASGGGNSLTIVRGQDGTSAQAHDTAAVVKHMITARDLQDAQNHIEASSGGYTIVNDGTGTTQNLHGIAAGEGSVVGTAKTQSLTNKTVNLTSNTLTGTTAQFNTALSDGNFATQAGTETLTNKTVNLTDNTLSGTKAQFNAALSDADFATIAGTETLTNKTLTSPVITGGTVNGGSALTVDSTELNYVDGVTSAIQTQLNLLIPAGLISPFGGSTAPTGWLLCQGQAVSRTTYASLYTAIGTTYGIGDNSTTFNLPDLLGRAPIGSGTGTGLTGRTLGTTVGAESYQLSEGNLPQHGHTVSFNRRTSTADTHDHEGWTAGDFAAPPDDRTSEAETTQTVTTGTGGGNGSATPYSVMSPSTVVNFIIKF